VKDLLDAESHGSAETAAPGIVVESRGGKARARSTSAHEEAQQAV